MEAALYHEMHDYEERHWWFRGRRRIVASLLKRHLSAASSHKPKLLDLGCGCGANLASLSQDFDVWGLDCSPTALQYAVQRLGSRVCIGSLPDSVPFEDASFDAVILTDVLEHLDDDRASLNRAARLLRPDGILLLTVPAGPWLFAPRDVAHHHRRRYTKSSLCRLLYDVGLEPVLLSHYNTALFVPGAFARWASRHRGGPCGTDLTMPNRFLNGTLASVMQTERKILPFVYLPFGLSLISVARPRPTKGRA